MSADPLAGISAAATRPPLRVTGMASARAAAGAAPPLEPPPSLASLGLRADGDGGGGLVADRAFRAGAVVLPDDRPILVAPALRPSHPASKLLEPYFQKTHIPASVVLKLAAFLCAEPQAAERLAALPCPPLGQGGGGSDGSGDGGDDNGGSGGPSTATKPHPLAEQARAFAAKLSENPPPVLPAGTVAGWPPADAPEGGELEARWRALWRGEVGERRAGRAWVLWSLGARPTPGAAGSALGAGPAALAHVCRGANTMYVAPGEGGSGGGGGGGVGGGGGGAGGAGHVALRPIEAGEALTSCYLGTGRAALLATAPERRRRLEEEGLAQGAGAGCCCASCGSGAVDAARGLPCPECSAAFRGADRLLTPEAARVATAETDGGGGGGGDEKKTLGYVYLSGSQWRCDHCAAAFPDDTNAVLGRFYRTHATIERDMSALARRVDASLDDSGPMCSDVRQLAARVEGVARLLGPRHAAVWRLRLAQAECHAGEAERLLAGLGPGPAGGGGGGGGRMAAALDEVGEALGCVDRVWDAVRSAPFELEVVGLAADVLLSPPGGELEGGSIAESAAATTPAASPAANGADEAMARREAVAAESLAHHAVELCSLAREACALAAASPGESDATAERRRELSARAAAWLARVDGAVRGLQRVRGRGGGGGAAAPSAAAAERSNAQVREIVGELARMAVAEGVK